MFIHQQQIKKISEQLEIPYLVHFTCIENINSIVKNGIHSRDSIEKSNFCEICYVNDTLRLDGHTNAISVSIGHPNEKMLYKLRKEDRNAKWAVLVIDNSVLWNKNCAFYYTNAANNKFKYERMSSLKTPQAFLNMFKDKEGCYQMNYPIDVQAEVLVFDTIETSLISCVVFNSEFTRNKFTSILKDISSLVHPGSTGFFSTPSYAVF